MKAFISISVVVLFCQSVGAQVGEVTSAADEGLLSLQVENKKTHKRAHFSNGQIVKYRTHSSRTYKEGWISGISDSTISFKNEITGNETISLEDLSSFKIRRSKGRRVIGAFFAVYGSLSVIEGVALQSTPDNHTVQDLSLRPYAGLFVLLGLAQVGGGMALMSWKKMDFEKSWTLRTISPLVQKEISAYSCPPTIYLHKQGAQCSFQP